MIRRVLLAAALCACSKSVVIESNTAWSGAVGTSTADVSAAHSLSGTGNTTVGANSAHVCWFVQKTTRAGMLRVYLLEHSIVGADRVNDSYTVADFGIVAGCN